MALSAESRDPKHDTVAESLATDAPIEAVHQPARVCRRHVTSPIRRSRFMWVLAITTVGWHPGRGACLRQQWPLAPGQVRAARTPRLLR